MLYSVWQFLNELVIASLLGMLWYARHCIVNVLAYSLQHNVHSCGPAKAVQSVNQLQSCGFVPVTAETARQIWHLLTICLRTSQDHIRSTRSYTA